MARDINWDEPLSDEDRAWAEQRLDAPAGFGMNVQERLAQNDEKFGKAAKDAGKSRQERMAELRTIIADSQNELERLTVEEGLAGNPNVAKQGDPRVGLVLDNTAVDGQAPEGAPVADEDYSDTKYWTVPRLQEEIDARNVDRKASNVSELNRNGKRSELVERLQQDDRELAEAQED